MINPNTIVRGKLLRRLDTALHQALGALHIDDPGFWEPMLHGMAQQDIHALVALASMPDPTPTLLGKAMLVPNSTVTGILDRLEKRGLVRRETDPHSRRSYRLVVTPAGSDHVAAHDRGHAKAVHTAASALSDDELSTFVVLLEKVLENES